MESGSSVSLDHLKAGVPQLVFQGLYRPAVSLDACMIESLHPISRLEETAIPTVGETAREIEAELRGLESGLQDTVAISAGLWDERNELIRRVDQVDARLEALDEDLQRHKDSRTLVSYGAEHAHELLSDHICPTCHQDLEDEHRAHGTSLWVKPVRDPRRVDPYPPQHEGKDRRLQQSQRGWVRDKQLGELSEGGAINSSPDCRRAATKVLGGPAHNCAAVAASLPPS